MPSDVRCLRWVEMPRGRAVRCEAHSTELRRLAREVGLELEDARGLADAALDLARGDPDVAHPERQVLAAQEQVGNEILTSLDSTRTAPLCGVTGSP